MPRNNLSTNEQLSEAFKTLAIQPTTNMLVVRKASRDALQKVHPDRPGGSVTAATAVNIAKDVIEAASNQGVLGAFVERPKAAEEAFDVESLTYTPPTLAGAFPDAKKLVIIEDLGLGRYAAWVYGHLFQTDRTAKGIFRSLCDNLAPPYDGSPELVKVWVFSPGKYKIQVRLADIVEALKEQEGVKTAPPPKAEALVSAPVDPPVINALTFDSLEDHAVGFLIYATGQGIQLYTVRPKKGRLVFTLTESFPPGAHDSVFAYLKRDKITPATLPIWMLSPETDMQPRRL